MKDMLCFVLRIFTTVTTCIVCIIGILLAFSEGDYVPSSFLWQVPVVAALTSIPSHLYYIYKIPLIIRFALHYIVVLATVFVSGYLFEWFFFNALSDYLILWTEITLIYAITFIVGYIAHKKKSDEINRGLAARRK